MIRWWSGNSRRWSCRNYSSPCSWEGPYQTICRCCCCTYLGWTSTHCIWPRFWYGNKVLLLMDELLLLLHFRQCLQNPLDSFNLWLLSYPSYLDWISSPAKRGLDNATICNLYAYFTVSFLNTSVHFHEATPYTVYALFTCHMPIEQLKPVPPLLIFVFFWKHVDYWFPWVHTSVHITTRVVESHVVTALSH
jgi:hypothetical protein